MASRDLRESAPLWQTLSGLSDDASRDEFLGRHPQLISSEVVTAIAEAVWTQVRVDVPQAVNLADGAQAIARKLDDSEALARALRAKANTFYARGDNSQAVDLHQQAAALFEAVGKPDEVARTLSGSIQPLLLMGEYSRAFAAGERARQIFSASGNSWRLARLEINIGNIYYRQDRFSEAIDSYERAYSGLKDQNDFEAMAAVLSNMATCYISLSEFGKALATHRRARQICQQHGMLLLVTQADYNIAYLYFQRGEYSRAIGMLRTTRADCERVNDTYHLALCNLDLAELYLDLNLSAEAAELAHQGYEGFSNLGMGYEGAKCLAFAAMAAGQQGHAFEALQVFLRAREMFVKEKNRAWPSLIDLYRALVFFDEGRIFEGRRLCLEARKAFAELDLTTKAVLADLLLARIALRTQEWDQAEQHCLGALRELADLGTPALSYQAHSLMGRIHRTKGNPDQAYDEYQKARQDLEALRSSLHNQELKIAFVKNRLEVYEDLIEICLARGPDPETLEEIFGYIEQAKSRSLMDLFLKPVQTTVVEESGVSELVRSIRDLREELNWYYNLIEREQLKPATDSPERIAKLRGQARARENDLVRRLQEATGNDADAAGLQTPTYVPLSEVRAAIPQGTLLVEYFRVHDRILACLLGRDTLEIAPVTVDTRVADFLKLLQFQLSKFRLDAGYVSTFHDAFVAATNSHLHELYDELIAPIRHKLVAEHLVFIPHGQLHYVPFHALFDGEKHLVDDFAISYCPSASIYALAQARTANAFGPALILGVPDVKAPAIRTEVESLATVVTQSELFVGPEATEQVLREKGPYSRLIHIATHGSFRQDNPMFSAIRLGDSFLSLYDLYQLRLPVELITLSGCATGLSVVAAGDELLGLARGLMHAGAQSLVLSLWDVHDESTTEYMTAFYRRLAQGDAKPRALQAAMLELRSKYPHPYQWAPFVLVGKA